MKSSTNDAKNVDSVNPDEISPEVSKRICSHMNDDHAISVYAMAKKACENKNSKLTNAKMKSISLSGYKISFVICEDDVCEMKNVMIPFDPPLKSQKEARVRIIQDHEAAFTPTLSSLFTEPVSLSVFLLCISFPYIAYMVKEDDIAGLVYASYTPMFISNLIEKSFCCTYTFASNVKTFAKFMWYLSIVAHVIEGSFAAYLCVKRFKLPKKIVWKWHFLGCCVGYAQVWKIFHLVSVDNQLKNEKQSENKSK